MNSVRKRSGAKAPAGIHQYAWEIEKVDGRDTPRYGGKGAGLARMAAAGIPVPPAFVIGTDGYRAYRDGGALPAELVTQTEEALRTLEAKTGRRFGAQKKVGLPLLVSVRSGAQISMPGMMDTVLNLGITAGGAAQLAAHTHSGAFAVDTFLRFWRMFSEIVLDVDPDVIMEAAKPLADSVRAEPVTLQFEALQQAVLAALANEGADDVRPEPHWQLVRAIAAVFQSWDSSRARAYREHHHIPDDLGTAVTVQAMVFGNMDARSGSGVAFTRNPNTGEPTLYGEFLTGRQGEDLVSGSATPVSIATPGGLTDTHRKELHEYGTRLEQMYGDAVDIEFTVEAGRLYLLQVRPAKRTAQAAVRIATDLAGAGLIQPKTAVQRVSIEQLKALLRPEFEPAALARAAALASGIGASPGHALGVAIVDADRAAAAAAAGENVVLLRPTTSPQDVRGMLSARAVVTARGGALSHAAVVSRALDIPCVVGCESIQIDLVARTFCVGEQAFKEGAPLSVDGGTGKIYSGMLPLAPPTGSAEHIDRLLEWADDLSGTECWVSGVTGVDARTAMRGRPPGFGVIALTDLLIAAGTLDEFVHAINALSHQPESKEAQKNLTRFSYDACYRLFLEIPDIAVDLRLPHLGSPRAQHLIGDWAALAPRLFLPLGMKGFYIPVLRGIADAAREARHHRVTPLLPGITSALELTAFRSAAAEMGVSVVGAVLKSPAALADMEDIAACGQVLWIDVRETARTFYGYPSALSFGDDVFAAYVSEGHLHHDPSKKLGAHLGTLLRTAIECAGKNADLRIGVECGEGVAPSLIGDLYAGGARVFSVPLAALSSVRLALGQRAAEE